MFDFVRFFIAPAFADTATPAAAPVAASGQPGLSFGGLADALGPQAIVFLIILALFYVLMIRPQQQQLENHKGMLKKLQKGDQIVTGGGIHGTVTKAEGDEHISVEISDGVVVKILRSTVSHVLKSSATEAAKS